MKKEIFLEEFNYYLSIKEQSEKYDKFMKDVFNEERDANFSNWYEQKAYEHLKKIFQINYNDDNEWFDYFLFECLFSTSKYPNVITCNNKEYVLIDVESFYNFCENELRR